MVKLKNSVNYWEIFFKIDVLECSTILNSGFIDDIDIILKYFIKKNPKASSITIKKCFKENLNKYRIDYN
jgi:hypothetical protein